MGVFHSSEVSFLMWFLFLPFFGVSIVYFWLFASLHFYVHGSACSVFFYNAVLCYYYYCVVVLLEKRSTPVSQFLFKISDN